MLTDFFFRGETDPNYKEDVFMSTDEIENTVQQVRMTLLTKKGEVLGEPNFGLDTAKYLFEFEGYPVNLLEKEASSQIEDFVMLSKIHNVEATAFTLDDLGDVNKVGLVLDIAVNGKRTFAAFYDE